MNRIFRVIWSRTLHTWVVASELARRHGKGGSQADQREAPGDLVRGRIAPVSAMSPWPLRLGVFLALLASYGPAQATDRYWDPNNTVLGYGGTGTWNTSDPFWSPNNDGTSGPYNPWGNAALDDAFFGGTAGTVTLAGPITVHGITFQTNSYTLTGGSLTLAGVDPTLTVTTGNSTIASTIDSTAMVYKAGAGGLTLSADNTFAGGLTVNAGSLSLTGDNSFGSSPVVVGGTLSLSGTNSFVGDINVNGTLNASGAASLGDLGNNIIISGGSLTIGTTGGDFTGRRVTLSGTGAVSIGGAGIGGAHFTGTGGLSINPGVNLTDDSNDYTGPTNFFGAGGTTFSSIGNLGEASSLGAPTTVANGTINIQNPSGTAGTRTAIYVGDGDVSNRNWVLYSNGYRGTGISNSGTGTLTLTGAISANHNPYGQAPSFTAATADLELLGVISGNDVAFSANAGHVLRLGDANTFSGNSIGGAGKVEVATLANTGLASSLGAGSSTSISGTLSYIGSGASTNRNWSISNGTLDSDGSGAMTLSGNVTLGGTATLGGSFTGGNNVIAGVVSGSGNLRSNGDGTWLLSGANTYTGQTIVDSGTLRAGTADAFGNSSGLRINGGTLDFNNLSFNFLTLNGSGGTLALGSGTLTLAAAEGTTASYAGSITGSGGLTKLGASTQTLTGASTYTGDTTIGGGTLALDFSAAGGPTSDIIGSDSTLDMSGGKLDVIGAAGEANTQTFDGLNITAGNNTIGATSGSGGSVTVNLGAITRTGGLMNFNLPTDGNITTTNTTLGGWATVNGTDYAKVVGGNILAFTEADYTDKDNAANWLDDEFITDVDGFYGTVTGSVQLGGLRYTQPVSTTVTIEPGETLGVDGAIIVAPTVLATNQVITGGTLTGANGGDLGIRQNSTGNFTITSQIVDNGTPMGFVKAGTGLVTLTNANNTYTGATRVVQGTLSVVDIGDGGEASSIGASSADASNLSLEGATLSYTGGTSTSDRGFTIGKSGAILGSGVEVTNAGANLTLGGLLTSADGAGFVKSGAGTLTLANDTNDITGVVTVTGGLLSVDTLADGGQVSGIGAGTSDPSSLVLDGGGLQYTGATTGTNRGLTLGANNGTIDVSDAATTLTVSGTLVQQTGGNRKLTKNGAGTLVLSGTNTYTGGNTVNAGVLRAGSTQAFGAPNTAATMTLANAAGVTLDLNNFNNTIGPLDGGGANGGNVTLGSATLRIAGGDGNYSGTISGTGGIERTNGGTQTFNGCNNTYTGRTYLNGGSVSTDCLADGGLASGIGASSNSPDSLVFNNASLIYTGGSVDIDRGFRLFGGTGAINVSNVATTLGFSGQVYGGGSLRKDGAGTLVLSGSNTSTGNTQVSGGILRAGTTNAFGPSGEMTLDNTSGVLLDLDGFDTTVTSLIGGGANGGNIDLGGATLRILDGVNRTYAGTISGTGSLVKSGTRTQALGGCDSSYTGPTVINGGTLQVTCLPNGGVDSSIGASTSDAANLVINGTLRYVGSGDATDRQFTLGAGGGTLDASGSNIIEFAYGGAVTLAGANTARTLTLTGTNTGENAFYAQLDDNGAGATSLTKTGTGTWRLVNNNSTYTGATTISGGVLIVDQMADGGTASSIGASSNAASNLVIGNGSTLRYVGDGDTTDRQFTLDTGVTYIQSSGTGALQFTNTGAVALTGTDTARTMALGGTNTGDNTFGGTIGDNGAGATTLAKNDSGTWILTGDNTFTGNTVINDGNLMIGNGGTTGNAGAGNVIVNSPTSTLSLNRSDTFTFSGTLSGPGTLAQVGSGTSVLTSTLNDIGATTIGNGTLQVDGSLLTPTVDMTGTSALTVNGIVQAAGTAQTTLSGDAGDQTVTVGSGGTLLASGDLGDGSDTVDLTGTLDTGAGAMALGDGDDTLVLHDGAQMLGGGLDTAGGAGTDTLVVDTALGYALDGGDIDTFDILVKQNTGELTLTGDHDFDAGTSIEGGSVSVDGTLATPTLSMADGTMLNVDGSMAAADGTAVAITGSTGANAIRVGSDGSLDANGDLGDGADIVLLAGSLDTGTGTLELGAGDDQLVLQDGAQIAGLGVDAGTGSNDTLVLDNASDLSFDGSQTAGFEFLRKDEAGEATMSGEQSFSGGTTIDQGSLVVDGALETPAVGMADGTALDVEGSLQASGGTQAVFTGSPGDNTVRVGADGTLLASGDLGDGADVLDVAGTLDTGGGTFALGDGDDILTIHDGTSILGTVSAGAGTDTFNTDIDTVADLGAVQGFETLSKTGAGKLDINGPMSSDFTTIDVLEGVLDVTAGGSVVAPAGETLDTTVAAGATLNVDGSYTASDGNDSFDLAGTVSGSGSIDLGDGDDTLTLHDGAVLANAVSGGTGTSDMLVLDNALDFMLDTSLTSDFELLQKDNAGTATLTGSQSFVNGTTILDGTLDVDGSLETPNVAMLGDTTLNVDGTLNAGPVDPTIITGSTGTNTVAIGAGGTAMANGDLGDGADVLDVAGTLEVSGGDFMLGSGDDNFIVHDGTVVTGTVDGGDGLDTRTYDIDTTADLGALVNFEGVTKTGTGVLNINGPAATELQEVQVLEGTLNVAAGGSVAAIPGGPLDTLVAAGATLNVDGNYGCGDGNDSMDVSGTVSGSGTIDLCGGDDTLTLHDGADLTGLANPIDGDTGSDTLVLDNAGAMTLDAGQATNFEVLQKDNAGEATLTGMQTYSGGTTLDDGSLTVAGLLQTPTLAMADDTVLNVDGLLAAGPGAATAITGSAGVNTINVAAGALLAATGDLGDGNDVLSVAGTLDTAGGTFSLGAGDDTFQVFDTTNTADATIDGGAGNDTLDVNVGTGHTVPLGSLLGFESLGKSGQGTLEIQGPSSFIDVGVHEGLLRVTDTGGISATTTVIDAGSTLELAGGGSYTGTSGADTFTVAGTLVSTGTQTGTLDLGDGDDNFTIQDGADLSGLATPVDGGAGTDTFVANLAGEATLGGAVDFETLTKTNTGTLHVAGPAMSAFSTVNVLGGLLDVGIAGSLMDVQSLTVASGAGLNVDGTVQFTPGADSFVVAGNVGGLGSIDMLDGDDVLTLQDGADLSGLAAPISGGAGNDTLLVDIAGDATLGGVTRFETLAKTNTGTLHVAGPAPSDFTTVNVDGGTLDVGAAGSISDVVTTTVAAGATLNVDGSYTGSAGSDMMTVAGMVGGTGTIGLGDGDDTLTLQDGAVLANVIDGGAHNTGDTVVLDNADALSFDASNTIHFEFLQKNNTGTATLTGTQAFSGDTTINAGTLAVAGTLDTPTVTMADDTVLDVAGTLDAATGTPATLTGSVGTNTVTVGAGGMLLATGDLGEGADVLDVSGTLDTAGGAFALGDGDDNFIVHDGTVVSGTVDGGAGLDTRTYDINATADVGALLDFEGITKTGTGVLNLNGPAATALQEVQVLGGTLNVAAGGSVTAIAGTALDTVVAAGATLNVEGSYGCGDSADTMTVAGTVSGSGTIDLCGGDDTLTLQDGAVLAATISGGDHGAGDTVVLDNAGALDFDASHTTHFEFLQKDNTGTATLTGTQAFSGGTTINGGTLAVAGTLATPTVAMADDAVLDVAGTLDAGAGTPTTLTGSAGTNTVTVDAGGTLVADADLGPGDDRFTSSGTVRGAFAFGAGNDTAAFVGGDFSGVSALDGGAGTDRLSFSGLTLASAALPTLTGWERTELLDASTLTLDSPLDLDGGTLAIDATSKLIAPAAAAVAGSVENAGTIDVGANRLAISGDYVGNGGTLKLDVSPATLASGGLDVGGDVRGTTALAFGSDGSKVSGAGEVSILVIASPNDDPNTDGRFVAADTVDGSVRLEGSLFPWSFGQEADHNWYLKAQAGLLPELPAYAVLPTLGTLLAQQEDEIVHQRLAGARGTERPQCGQPTERPDGQAAGIDMADDCHGFWMAASGSSTDLGADPGFAASGSNTGLYMGLDYAAENTGQTVRIGAYLGYLRGNYRTTGINSTALPGIGRAGIRLDTPVGGWYGSMHWSNGAYVEAVVSGQRNRARVRTSDGFTQVLDGGSVTVSAKAGRRYALDSGWSLEPQLRLIASDVTWHDQTDGNGRSLAFAHGWVNTARAGLRVEKGFTTEGGATIKPWLTVAVQDTFGQRANGLAVTEPGDDGAALALPNQDLGTTARLDAGVEARMGKHVSLFGVMSASHSLDRSSYREQAANLGVRVRW